MASIISASTTSNTALNMTADTTGVLQLATGATPTTAVTIDASQNVGIGTASPTTKLDVNGAITTRAVAGEGGEINIINPDNSTIGLYVDVLTADIGRIFQTRNNSTLQLGQLSGTGGIVTIATAATERMRIDSSGRVTMSAQPRFLADRSSNQTGYNSTSTGDVVVIYNATTQNVGSHFSTSTGKFTAPVAGMYIFQGSAYSEGGTAFTQAWLVVNGARAANSDQVYSSTGNAIFSATFLIYLSANDTVGYHPYNGSNTNQTITTNGNHTWFKGYLIS